MIDARRSRLLPLLVSLSVRIGAGGALLAACGGGGDPAGARCRAPADGRPVVELAWQVEHESMDDDPPRPRVTLVLKGASEERVVLGELRGTCKLVELGLQPDQPVYGSGVSELTCEHEGSATHARVVHESASELVVRLWERSEADGAGMKNVRDLKRVSVPACARFTSELATPTGI